MNHGKNVTIGCVPIDDDDAIEDVFYLGNAVGMDGVPDLLVKFLGLQVATLAVLGVRTQT